jgi:hypothetical protein
MRPPFTHSVPQRSVCSSARNSQLRTHKRYGCVLAVRGGWDGLTIIPGATVIERQQPGTLDSMPGAFQVRMSLMAHASCCCRCWLVLTEPYAILFNRLEGLPRSAADRARVWFC